MAEKIDKNITFGELLQRFPNAGPILAAYGLHCIGCHIGVGETLEEGVHAHGMDDKTLGQIVSELNKIAG